MAMRQALPWFRPHEEGPCFCGSDLSFGECCGSRDPDRKPPAGVHLFPGFLDPASCKKWVKRLEGNRRQRAKVNKIQRPGASAMTTEDDPVRVCSEVQPGSLRTLINQRVAEAFKRVAATTGHTVAWYELPLILRYRAGGYYLAHADSCALDPASKSWFKIRDRDLSLLIYLNEDFTGGGLTFVNFNYHFRPKPGDLLVFPSDNRYAHQAERVESGIRYVIVSWAALRETPKVCDRPPELAVLLPEA